MSDSGNGIQSEPIPRIEPSQVEPGLAFFSFAEIFRALAGGGQFAACRMTVDGACVAEFGSLGGETDAVRLHTARANYAFAFKAAGKGSLAAAGIFGFLVEMYERGIEKSDAAKQAEELSPYLAGQQARFAKIAASNLPVYIQGETGTGKHFLAKRIHAMSGRGGIALTVDVSSIPEALFESELFGHAKGAFTDAAEDKPGKLESALGGTVVLSGVDGLSLFAQAKLLRVLQDGGYFPLGSNRERKLDCRIVCLSRVDLEDAVAQGEFRRDLLYRIKVLPIYLPALRDRREDIAFFLRLFQLRHAPNERPPAYADTAMQLDREWRGNIREVENFILANKYGIQEPAPNGRLPGGEGDNGRTLKAIIMHCKRKAIHDTLSQCGGNQTKAARVLGVQRTYLAKLIKDFSQNDALED